MTPSQLLALTDPLQAAMPSSVAEFYDRIRGLSPDAWAHLAQKSEPRMAAIGALQTFNSNPHFGITPEALVEHFQILATEKEK